MDAHVTYRLDGSVATLAMDDGKVNALSLAKFAQLNRALDQAEVDRAVVVLTGRPGVFSAGFDLTVLKAGGPAAAALLRAGFELSERLLAFPAPVVIACTGHAIAMGVFIVLSGDYRIGTTGAYKITANEVAIGMTLPWAAIEICRQRLTPAHLTRAIALAEPFSPDDAVAAGFLDRAVPAAELAATAHTVATMLGGLDRKAHTESKRRMRHQLLETLHAAIEADDAEFRARP